ncbi:hypothetical protein CO057_03360 [Candidatus Uhrbacteria bacterium CG_4_9_14_0_2_um_filter_41_50]|uniref:Peptidase S8/S53 domain-containing protein n=1 Tax=Candidatus Uhrbacteria bacterium CG_4_9_14_0_2_um_filter_41_50 TaxID=1975031 RepID=A0A2M8ENV6_9BACT|nr:MAG: hypothetical protein COZ45_03510 [Candidatus Uhrbacteria bacterium CG_4_10_14_3_um_filter_41_21]PIZ55100.1 MAG: hypothetical protein COY24_01555 [Candidatus Uhrbacteria bacterium CG_4_10_14_0_2_um_filter_41_21]PJB84430.1 MAG: hypothetical protein CO086_03680 [Candidatus Uhrbacteria bacterium CG_4_9_14_0_8_um_filter_41_16]PJC24337.1 MAG: hypothetical protein CO057_03360 [Candidatus Uhrbacteria bacterium CG_4_9_14_0_2_um_filter_41_50]PJE75300.1 MAG: hypothetical protein COV03_00845 [Candi
MRRNKKIFIKTIAVLVLVSMPTFVFAEVPNDAFYDQQWYLEQIGAPNAWDTQTGSNEIIIAVLDTGVDLDHPDLVNNLWKNTGEISRNSIDDDSNGYVDDIFGWDFINDDNSPTPDTGLEASSEAVNHGSLIAGIVGAGGDNKIGVSGINWNISIMSVRILDAVGSGDANTVAQAVYYAVDNGADVINMSFTGNVNDPILRNAVKFAYEQGVVIVSALGNEGEDVDNYPVFPACYKSSDGNDDWVIGVASLGKSDKRSVFSNYGSTCTDLSAPGEDIYGVSYFNPSDGYDDKYVGGWSGTSMASPMVAGAAGILLSQYPNLTPTQVRNALKLSVDPVSLDSEYTGEFGAGRLNISQALTIARNFVDQTTETDNPDVGDNSSTTSDLEYSVKAPSFASVYYVTGEGRRAFISSAAYFTWFDSFEEIANVQDQDLSAWSLSGLMLPKAGVVLVKIQSDPQVYALAENSSDEFSPLLRAIPDEQTAIALYGNDWADYVIDIEPTFFAKFSQGEPMSSSETVDKSIMKRREDLTN